MRVQFWAVLLSAAALLLAPAIADAQKGGGGKGGGGGGRSGGGGGGEARGGGGGGRNSGGESRSGGGSGRSSGGQTRSGGGGGRPSVQQGGPPRGSSERAGGDRGGSVQRPQGRPPVAAPNTRAPGGQNVQRSAPRSTTRDFVDQNRNTSRDSRDAQRSAQNRADAARQEQQNLARDRDDDRNRYTSGYRGERDDRNRNVQNRDRDGDRDRNDFHRNDFNRDGRDNDWVRDNRDRYRDGRYQVGRRYDHNYWGNRSYFLGATSPFGNYLGYPWWYGGRGNRFGFYPGYGYGYGLAGRPGYYTYQSDYAYAPGGYYDNSGYVTTAPATQQVVEAPAQEKLDASLDYAGQGETAFKNGRYEEAAQLWRHALVDDPSNGAIVLLLSQALFQTGQWEEAAGAVQQAARMLPEERWGTVVQHYKELYGSYAQDYTDQLKQLEEARKEASDSAAHHFLLGYHFGYLGYPKQSVRELDVALKNAPEDAVAKRLRDMMSAKLEGGPAAQGSSF